jgi:Dyp-type peroxidase family
MKPYLNIGFSYPGLAELGVDKAVLSGFPEAFAHGMDARADALGDPPPPSTEQAQRHWTKAFDPTKPVHAVVFVQCAPDRVADLQAELLAAGQAAQSQSLDGACSVAAATPGDVSRLSERLRADLQQQLDRVCADFGLDVSGTASSERPYLIGYQDLHRPLVQPERPGAAPYGVEYFGFRDGLGQPQLPKGALQVGSSGWLGERDSYDVVLRREPHGLLKNASFLVARQLRQHTDAFWDGMQARAQTLGIGKRELAEQIVGRRMDGRRLDSNQPHFDPVRDRHAFDPDRENPGCPFHSHVRRVNPRTETSAVRNPQLMRRSLAYSNKRAGADVKGLMFMAFNADLETQFELIQRNWIQAGNQVGLTSHDRDVLVGLEVPPQPHADSHPARFYADSKRELTFDHAFVELEWGIYLYFPAKDALFQL